MPELINHGACQGSCRQGLVDSVFTLMSLPLRCPDYSLVSRRAKTVSISIKTPTRGEISHLVIDSSGLKVFGEGEWKVRQHGADRRRVWRKLHLAADSATHEIICADLSLSGTTDAQALPGLMPHSHSKRNKVTHLPESDKITVLAILESLLHAGKTSDSERTVLHRKAAW